jgi:hypothetical protein
MKNFRFLRLVWVLLLSLFSVPAAALPKLQMQPVDLIGYVGTSLRVAVPIPCGGEFYGIIASTNEKQKTMALAAAVSIDSIVCTSIPSQQEVIIDYLDVTGFKSIEPMSMGSGSNRLAIARISDMKITRSKDVGNRLKVVYEPRCGRGVGTLIRATGKDRIEIAMVEKPATGAQKDGCERRPTEREITAIDVKVKKRVATLSDKVESLTRQYTLKLAPVSPKGIRTGKNGGLTFRYRKKCNDAPLGVVVSDEKIVDGRKTALIGMLIANYYNIPCTGKEAGTKWEEHADSTILIPKNVTVGLMNTSDAVGLMVKAPTRITTRGSKSGKGRKQLVLKHAATCGQIVGGVYSRDGKGGLSVGILTQGQYLSSNACKNETAEVSLSQPYFIGHQRMETLYPLRLKGQSSR